MEERRAGFTRGDWDKSSVDHSNGKRDCTYESKLVLRSTEIQPPSSDLSPLYFSAGVHFPTLTLRYFHTVCGKHDYACFQKLGKQHKVPFLYQPQHSIYAIC